jgi:hypothetical protein
MTISTAVQRKDRVDVYNEKNDLVGSHLGKLHGYSNSSVSIRRNGAVDKYDENGLQISSTRVP